MLRYYAHLLRQVPSLLIEATDRMANVFAFTVLILSALFIGFNVPIGQQFNQQWLGISPWWVLVPIGCLVMFGLAKANYAKVVAIERERNTLSERLSSIQATMRDDQKLNNLYQQGDALRHRLETLSHSEWDYATLDGEFITWDTAVRDAFTQMGRPHLAAVFGHTRRPSISETPTLTYVSYDPQRTHLVNIIIQRLQNLAEILGRLT